MSWTHATFWLLQCIFKMGPQFTNIYTTSFSLGMTPTSQLNEGVTSSFFDVPSTSFHIPETPSCAGILSPTHTHSHVWLIFTYTLLSVTDMASSVKASLDTSLSLVLLTGAKEPTWQGLSESPLLYDLEVTTTGARLILIQHYETVPNRWVTFNFICISLMLRM